MTTASILRVRISASSCCMTMTSGVVFAVGNTSSSIMTWIVPMSPTRLPAWRRIARVR